MSVGVQQMVRPRAAGVAFTLNPLDGDRSQIAIDASWGFGEAVVSGEVTPDNFLVDKVMGTIGRRTISAKTLEYRLTAQDTVTAVEVEADRQSRPCLTDDEIAAVARLARRAEKHYRCPQDVEWAIDEVSGDVLLLQSRPETVWSRRPKAASCNADPITSMVQTLLKPSHSTPEAPAANPALTLIRRPWWPAAARSRRNIMADRFPSPFEMPTPPGAEGWQDLYAYSSVFSEDRREYEESAFWFMDGVHSPEAIPPWDATIVEYALIALSQYNTRHYVIPPARGVDIRFLNGYMYLSPVGVTDPEEIGARVPEFAERAGYYFQNWDRLYAAWLPKVRELIGELEAISFTPLPEREDMAVLTEGRGTGSALDLLSTYHRLVDLTLKLWQYHFEFLNLGYAAYLDFFGACKQLFPSIPDQAIAKMVAGIEVDLFRPDEEIKKLAQLAVELGIADRFAGHAPAEEVLAGLRGDPQGDKWLAAWEEAKQPWFNFSAGTAFYHSDKVWLEHLDIPLGFLRTYIAKVQRGETLERPMQAIIAERDRIVEEYADLIDSDEDRATFQAKLGLARTVFPYVENHNFYVEHWAHSVVWRKMRDLGPGPGLRGVLRRRR